MGGTWWEYLIAAFSALALFFLNKYTNDELEKAKRREEEKKKLEDEILIQKQSKKVNEGIAANKKKAETTPWK